ncbi:MAG: hypothetical protein K6B43_09795 [Treponema sp.]|nr:hypothetical protein [Treponema sp.]
MVATLTIQNADNNLLNALKSVIRLHPQARVSVKKTQERDFSDKENIRHLEELKRLDDEGKLHFVEKTMEELEAMAK